MLADAFAQIVAALPPGVSPFHPGRIWWPGDSEYDDGGSIVALGNSVEYPCMVQIDVVTESMRLQDGFTEKDVRLIVLAPGLERAVDTDATVEVLAGPHAGSWSVQGQSLDSVGCAFDGRGRAA